MTAAHPGHRVLPRPGAPRDPDAALVAALRGGDERALAELVRRHGRTMLQVARGHVGSALAEDVVQDAWIAVLRGVDGFEQRAQFRTWLMRILVNAARARRARERRAAHWADRAAAEEAPEPGPEQCVIARELRGEVLAALAELPARQGSVVVLRDLEGWTAEAVSAAMGISPANQRVLLHRGRVRMRELRRPSPGAGAAHSAAGRPTGGGPAAAGPARSQAAGAVQTGPSRAVQGAT